MRAREHDVARQRRHPARLVQDQAAQRVALALEVAHLLEHRLAGDVEHAADDDPARLALCVGVDAVDDLRDSHLLGELRDGGEEAGDDQREQRATPIACVQEASATVRNPNPATAQATAARASSPSRNATAARRRGRSGGSPP